MRPVPGRDVVDLRVWLACLAPIAADPRVVRWEPSFGAVEGAGVRLALLDSGLCWGHPAFAGAKLRARDFTGGRDLRDPSGHGTADAAMLIGQRVGGLGGVIPGSELLVGKVFAGGHNASVRAVVQGIRWAVERGADILVLPFGIRRADAGIARELRRAAAHGCTVLAAAGNSGPDEMRFPARMAQVRSVSGIGEDGRFLPICCAQKDVDLLAVGHEVPAIGPDGPTRRTGSSPATVLAAGLLALRLSAARTSRTVQPGVAVSERQAMMEARA